MKPLGKPVNNQVKSCDDVTANCVIWDGPNISAECLGLQIYQGDSIVPIIYNSFKNFCTLLQKVDLSNVDSSCIIELSSQPDTFVELINLINEKLCDNQIRIVKEENKAVEAYSSYLPYCLQIKSDTITITKLPVNEAMELVAGTICNELAQLEDLQTQLDPNNSDIYQQLEDLSLQINAQCNPTVQDVTQLCTSPNPVFQIVSATVLSPGVISYFTSQEHNFQSGTLVNIFNITPDVYNVTLQAVSLPPVEDPFNFIVTYISLPSGTPAPSISISSSVTIASLVPVEQAYEILEQAFCSMRNFTGTSQELYQAIARDCPNLADLPALSNSGTMRQIYGWIPNPVNVAQSINNLWLTICDLRTAIRTLLMGCCSSSPCLSFDIGYKLTFDPNNQFLTVIFQDIYFGPGPIFPAYRISKIQDLDRLNVYFNGAPPYPAWLDESPTSEFFDISTVKITLNDGSGDFVQDTGLTIMELMTLFGTGYQFNYPPAYDPTAPVKTIKIEFTYSYVLKITNVLINTPSSGKITFQTATRHPYVVGSKVDIMNVNPAWYDLMDATVTGIPNAFQFTINRPTIPAPPTYVSGGTVIQASTVRNCEECGCCCTFSLINGIY